MRNLPFSPSLPQFDIGQVIYDSNRLLNPLHKDFAVDYQVASVRDGFVLMTVAIPEGMNRAFAAMLESLSLLFNAIEFRSKSVKVHEKPVELDDLYDRQKRIQDFNEEVCLLFDNFIAEGFDRKDSIKRTNFALKAQSHPWATYDTVSRILSSCGRFRKKRASP